MTDQQIKLLRATALRIGDYALVNYCDMARLDPMNAAAARAYCAQVWATLAL